MGLYTRWVLPHIVDVLMRRKPFSEERPKVLADAYGKVLEIGLGTGLNLPYYTERVDQLTAVDPNPGMHPKARRRATTVTFVVEHLSLSAEALPFDADSFDCVTCTWTLCSIPDVGGALYEVRRVLKSGGSFLFVEHGASPDASVRKWQDRLTPLQRVVGDGCHLNREIPSLIQNSGLRMINIDAFYKKQLPRIGGFFYRGRAEKP